MYQWFIRIFLISSFLSLTLHAQSSRVVSFDHVGKLIRQQNPDLAAARLLIEEAEGRKLQAGRWANPEFEVSLEPDTRLRKGKYEAGISQKFPLTSRLLIEKNLSKANISIAKAEVLAEELRLREEAQSLMIDLLAWREECHLLLARADAAKDLVEMLDSLNQSGEVSSLDLLEAKLEATALHSELRILESQETKVSGKLKILLGMSPQDRIQISSDFSEIRLPDLGSSGGKHPELQVTKYQVEAATHRVELEKAQRYDDLEVGIFTAIEREEGSGKSYENESMIGLRLQWPWPLWNQNEGAMIEAQAKKKRKEQETHALQRRLNLEKESALTQMKEWKGMIEEIDQSLIPLSLEQTSLTQKTFQAGEGSIQSMLRSREKIAKFQLRRIQCLREFHLSRLRYQSALGNL